MTIQELKHKKGLRPVYFKQLDLSDFNIDLSKREVKMVWSAFNVKDSDGDIIIRGAFAKSINERGPASTTHRKIAYLKFHNYNLPQGPLTKLWEDDKYLIAIANIDPTPDGDVTITQYQTGTLNQHSIGYRYIWDKIEYSEQDDALICKEIDLWEGSAVVAGSNENTPLLEIRGQATESLIAKSMDELERLLKTVEIKSQYELRKSISTLLSLVESDEPRQSLIKNLKPEPKIIDWERIARAIKS